MNLAQQLAEQTGTVLKALLGPLRAEIAALKKRLEETPAPKDGQPGKDGRDGVDGKDGAPGADGKPVAAEDVATLVDQAVATLPVAKDGAPGRDGIDGKDGMPGEKGADGADGADGKDGEPGQAGRDGADGKDGASGERGADGKDGVDGADGAHGKDADLEMVKALVLDAVNALPVPKDGADGKSITPEEIQPLLAAEVAKAVAALPKPADGKSVPAEHVERMVALEVAKAMAAVQKPVDGRDGRDGKEGAPGRDALDIEVLPIIDTNKEYGRGTWAAHQGGLWRAFKNTDAMDGWECIVDGVAEIVVEPAGERGAVVLVRHASGKEIRKDFAIPMVIDRGVFRPEGEYAKGDGCTWGGSFFIAQKNAPSGKPGESDDWRLSVKRGRDGKDGRNGIDMTKAVSL